MSGPLTRAAFLVLALAEFPQVVPPSSRFFRLAIWLAWFSMCLADLVSGFAEVLARVLRPAPFAGALSADLVVPRGRTHKKA